MYNFYKMNLQLFADAGTLVNTSVNYANAYDKTQKTEFSGTNTLDPTTYYYNTGRGDAAQALCLYEVQPNNLINDQGKQVTE